VTNETTAFLIRDDILFIRPLEWNSEWTTFCGFPVRAWVSGMDCWFAFPNGYVVRASMNSHYHPEANEMLNCDVYPCLLGWYEMRFNPDISHTRSWYWQVGRQDATNFVRVLVSCARREKWDVMDEWYPPRYRPDAPLPMYVGEERMIACQGATEIRKGGEGGE
jgi:hypothetical protein